MGDMMRLSSSGGALGGGFHRDKLGSPSTGSEDGGGIDLADIAQELDQDEFDGPATLNGMDSLIMGLSPVVFFTVAPFVIIFPHFPRTRCIRPSGNYGSPGERVVPRAAGSVQCRAAAKVDHQAGQLSG